MYERLMRRRLVMELAVMLLYMLKAKIVGAVVYMLKAKIIGADVYVK